MKNEEQFFGDITDALHAHEDAYIDGAWESFVERKKRRRFPLYIKIASAAALLLILGYAALLYVPNSAQKKSQKYQAKTIIRPHQGDQKTVAEEGETNINATPAENDWKEDEPAIITNNLKMPKPSPNSPNKNKGFEDYNSDSTNIVANNIAATNNIPAKEPAVITQPVNIEPIVSENIAANIKRYNRNERLSYDSLAGLKKTEKTPVKSTLNTRAISYALQVSPSVGNEKLNFGTGVEVGYKLNKHISVSTGIGYSYINAGANRGTAITEGTYSNVANSYYASPSSNYATGTSQNVKGVRLALSGLEVPLSFQYKTAGGLYFSAGVAAMSIIGNNLSYNYLNNRVESVPSTNGLSTDIRIVSEESTKQSTENIRGYVGFYTFSAGKKLTIGHTQLKFAPFVKIPFTGVSSEKIQLLHGGVQLGIGF